MLQREAPVWPGKGRGKGRGNGPGNGFSPSGRRGAAAQVAGRENEPYTLKKQAYALYTLYALYIVHIV